MTLVIMAAGMGSRFGGLKQIEPVGPNNEIIADYSVSDAKKAGFNKVIFIIRKEHENYFRNNIINKYNGIKVDLVYQELDMVKKDVDIPKNREKMLGTAHAILCAKDKIDTDFVVINSDDFYGYDSFKLAYDFLNNKNNEYVSINYSYKDTKSKFGKVKRGVVSLNGDKITSINECEISEISGHYIARSLSRNCEFEINGDTLVSVNFFGFRHGFLDILENEFNTFIHGNITKDNEFLLTDVLKNILENNLFIIRSRLSNSKWIGMTYKEDLNDVKSHISKLINKGEYQSKLW